MSAVAYTLANISLRVVVDCDPFWVTTVKTAPTVLLAAPWMAWLALRGLRVVPARHSLGALVLVACWGHLGGNVAFQWALGAIGIALSVPLTIGAMILCSTMLGSWILHERVTLRNLAAVSLLILSIAVLSLAAPGANQSLTGQLQSPGRVLGGVLAAVEAGLAYAMLGVVIRRCSGLGVPISSTLTIVGAVGLVTMGGASCLRIGWHGMLQTAPADFAQMTQAGLWNALAFLSLAKALHLTPLFYVNALSASQIAMASLAGVWLFDEPRSDALLWGVGLTVAGLLLIQSPPRGPPADDGGRVV